MDFSLSEEQLMFRDLFRDFAEKEVARAAEHIDQAEELPADLLRKAAAQGFLGATIPEDYGGAGLDFLTFALFIEAIARECLSTAVAIGLHTMLASMTVAEAGSEAQKEAFLPRLAGGELGSFALAEPEAGSDALAMQTRAARANGHYVLNGVKAWVSNAGPAAVHVVFAQAEAGPTAFLVEAGTPGVEPGQREPMLGLRGLDVRRVYFDDCRVPAEQVLGEAGQAAELVSNAHARARLALAAAGLGAAEGALDLGVKFAIERKQFGTAIANKQAIQNYLAEAAIDIEALRHMVHYAAWLADTGAANPFAQATVMAKYQAARVAQNTANKMLQVHGGYGFSDEYAISRMYRDVRALRVLGGTDELQRLAVAGQVLAQAGVTVRP